MAASITLQKFGIVPDEEENHVFTFVFENPHALQEVKSVESSEVTYGGHNWSIVCMRKEDKYAGLFLKWRYNDGPSAGAVSSKAKYSLGLIHRQDYTMNKYFNSNQKFSSAQALLGKSKFITLDVLLNSGAGFLDETGKRVILELCLYKSSARFEKTVDISPKARTRKNASGYYFDTTTFLLANHRWYLRVYPTKENSNGLPAVYLYLAGKSQGALNMEVQFQLYIGSDMTEILTFSFGEGAKFDGFGKTLPQPLPNLEKVKELVVGCDVTDIAITKTIDIPLRPSAQNLYPSQLTYKDYGGSGGGSGNSRLYGGTSSILKNSNSSSSQGMILASSDTFQDMENNSWKLEAKGDERRLTVVFDKGVHHYQHNKTKLFCWSATLLSRDPHSALDLDMTGEPLVGYFSNFIEDKGYMMNFPIERSELEEKGSPYVTDQRQVVLRINMISVQTIPVGMRSIPRFEYQTKHLLRARRLLQERHRNLEEMREMAASRASLSSYSMLDISELGPNDSEQQTTPPGGSEQSSVNGGRPRMNRSYNSIDDMDSILEPSTSLSHGGRDDLIAKQFFSDMLAFVASSAYTSGGGGQNPSSPLTSSPILAENSEQKFYTTSRDQYFGAREDVGSVESGITVSDESSMLMEARPSPVDLNKHLEVASIFAKFLQQKLPLRVSDLVQSGSLGCGTSTRSRVDVDLIVFSQDIPKFGQKIWMPAMLNTLSKFIQDACSNPDAILPLPKASQFMVTPYSVQFSSMGLDIDIMLSHDWEPKESGGYKTLYDISCAQKTGTGRQWSALASSKLQRKFVHDQPSEVKELMKVFKHWRNCTQWRKISHRPNSYLLSLLVIKAVEETKSFDLKVVLKRVGSYVTSPELCISWSAFYQPDKYSVEFEPPTPLVRDPANPGVNVAETLSYWGQFRAEFIQWMKNLNISMTALST